MSGEDYADDDYRMDEGDVMPAAWWRVPDRIPLRVRYRHSRIPGLPMVAFADEFHPSLSVYGPRYLDLSGLTQFNARRPEPTPQRRAFDTLLVAFPDTFHTVIGRDGPGAVWLALRLTRLSDRIADTLLDINRTHGGTRAA